MAGRRIGVRGASPLLPSMHTARSLHVSVSARFCPAILLHSVPSPTQLTRGWNALGHKQEQVDGDLVAVARLERKTDGER